MNLSEKLAEIKAKLSNEEKNSISLLITDVNGKIEKSLENWLRAEYISVIVYPDSMFGKSFLELLSGDVVSAGESNFSPIERALRNHLKDEQNLGVASCMFNGELVISIKL
jgi:hypothetical protein